MRKNRPRVHPIGQGHVGCQVEYDFRGRRVRKAFTDIYEARQFYLAKNREGRNPKVVGGLPASNP